MEKTNIGSKLALYPMPVTVIGTMDGDKPEWLQVDHVGIIGHNRILVSMFGKHHTNPAIKASKKNSPSTLLTAICCQRQTMLAR